MENINQTGTLEDKRGDSDFELYGEDFDIENYD